MKRRKTTQKTPLQQTKISSFFSKGESSAKRLCNNVSPKDAESPDVILCTPPEKKPGPARRSLLGSLSDNIPKTGYVFETDKDAGKIGSLKSPIMVETETDSAFSENTPPSEFCHAQKEKVLTPKKPLQPSNIDNIPTDFNVFCADDFDDGWFSEKISQEVYDLDFKNGVICEVVRSDLQSCGLKHEQILVVKTKSTEQLGRCILRDMWALNINFSPGDLLTISAYQENGTWIVDAQRGYICLFPDLLVSSTSLVGAMFCRRRAVLSNYFKRLESENKIMVIGKFVHETLQNSLNKPECSYEDLEKIIDELLLDPANLRLLYSSDMTTDEVKRDLSQYIPFISNFLKIYVRGEIKPEDKHFQGVISDILDIEEDVSCLNLGIKGRVDVTVNVKVNGVVKKMPLELKTGRASFSQEHKSQVFLYTMMMSDMGTKIESGLLLYIKEGIMEEIKPSHVEIRDLILLRNDFAQYLRHFDANALPGPIKFVRACQKCPYSTVCTAFLPENIPKDHPVRSLEISFNVDHLAYFHKWTQLLILEDSYQSDDDLKLKDLTVEDGVVRLKNEFKYNFLKTNEVTSLKAGNIVVLTSNTASYTGRIVDLSDKHCSIALRKPISCKGCKFDVAGFKSSLLAKYLSYLGELMEESHKRLRDIIITKHIANVKEKFPKSLLKMSCLKILNELNVDQQKAVLKVLAAEDYLLIEGPPGTGKTQTIAAMIRIYVALNHSVLLVSHTHSSVDNVLLRLQDVDYLRLGNLSSINESLHSKSYAFLSQSASKLEDILSLLNKSVVASTCLGLDADLVKKRKFDICIVDESSQVLQPEVFKPLFAAKKFVLIGDPKQLRPVVRNPLAKNLGMDESVFERLYKELSFVSLTIQYRMNKVIMELANALTYENKLKVGSDEVANKVLSLKLSNVSEIWLKTILSTDISDSIVFVDTGDYLKCNADQSFSCCNDVEALLASKVVNVLLNCGLDKNCIGVMAPFRAQIKKLAEYLPKGVEVNTVDQYQGRDKDVIIFSCTKMDRGEGSKGDNELLNDVRRLTVSITRAKCKLVMIGDKLTLMRYKTFERFFHCLSSDSVITLEDGKHGFFWSDFQI